MRFVRLISFCFVPAVLMSSAACSTIRDAHSAKENMMTHYMAGQYDQAREILDDRLRPSAWYNDSVVGTGDEVMWRLEAGSLCFLQEDYDTGIAHFGTLSSQRFSRPPRSTTPPTFQQLNAHIIP